MSSGGRWRSESWIDPLAFPARCFTARALDVPKDECGFRCIEFPDGLPLATREATAFLTINGIQVQGTETVDMAPEFDELRQSGVGVLRLYPQAKGMSDVVRRFDALRVSGVLPERVGSVNGYWHERPGMAAVAG